MNKFSIYILLVAVLAGCGQTSKDPIDYVDPFVGTGFHGHTYPGATVPFGAVQLSPDTRTGDWDACSGYHYSDSSILGFSHTHLSGTGCADLGDILFHPTTKEPLLKEEGYIFSPLNFSHKDEKASAGYYSVEFKEDDIKAELTATKYTGVHRYTFGKGKPSTIIIDMAHTLGEEDIDRVDLRQTAPNEISGMRRTQGWVTNQYVYFVAQFSKDIETSKLVCNGAYVEDTTNCKNGNMQAVVNFGLSDGTPLMAKVGISIVSEENARGNLLNDVQGFDFDAVHQSARSLWTEALSDIVVKGGDESDLVNFYTAQYHTKIIPNIASDANGDYRKHNMEIGKTEDGKPHYSTFSLWDTFRAWHPLMTLTNHSLTNDMVNSLLTMYEYSTPQELPIWPLSAGETGTMIGYHSVSVIGDAYLKGIRGFDIEKAYEAMKRSSNINSKGSDYYIKYGFIPSNIKRESVSCLLEFAYDDWVIAQVAKSLGKEDDYDEYINRSLNYINVFDGYTKFFRGKRIDGNWDGEFNEFAPGRAYTEATAWQYRFFVPHDVNGMIQQFGGREAFVEELDRLFTVESKIDGTMSDITGLIGQYAHGNEPSHHMAYLYNYVGQPWKTQAMTRRLLKEMYSPTPEGIIGNEDCGQMSAWYILSSLGFYSVCPGSNEFALTSPLFKEATIKLANGKILEIKSNSSDKNIYIDKVILNGVEIQKNFITYQQLMEGGTLEFILGKEPNMSRGIGDDTSPYSLTSGSVVSVPYTTHDLYLFQDDITVDLGTATQGADIYYTLDGTTPTAASLLYQAPFTLTTSTPVQAVAMKEGYRPSSVFEVEATKAVLLNPVSILGTTNGVNYQYHEGFCQSVKDIPSTKLVEKGIMAQPDIAQAKQPDHFAYIFTGYINVPEDGVYTFHTKSDDGSVLYIGNKLVVDNDGSHAAIVASGMIALKKGYHSFRLEYFEDYEGEELDWGWKLPSSAISTSIPADRLYVK